MPNHRKYLSLLNDYTELWHENHEGPVLDVAHLRLLRPHGTVVLITHCLVDFLIVHSQSFGTRSG